MLDICNFKCDVFLVSQIFKIFTNLVNILPIRKSDINDTFYNDTTFATR